MGAGAAETQPDWFTRAVRQITGTGREDAVALITAFTDPDSPDAPGVVVDLIPRTGEIDRDRATASVLTLAWMARVAFNERAMREGQTFDDVFQRVAAKLAALPPPDTEGTSE